VWQQTDSRRQWTATRDTATAADATTMTAADATTTTAESIPWPHDTTTSTVGWRIGRRCHRAVWLFLRFARTSNYIIRRSVNRCAVLLLSPT